MSSALILFIFSILNWLNDVFLWGNNPDTELVTPYIVIKSFGVNAKYLLFIIYFSKLIIDLFFSSANNDPRHHMATRYTCVYL
jgi:hypothetical protein